MTPFAASESRVQALVRGAARLADPSDPLGIELRSELERNTLLSPEGVRFALARCLETRPTGAEIAGLVASVAPAARAHVLLSANVFVAAHRAIALALASSPEVDVRPSRREPAMARFLGLAAPGLFRVVERLEPASGDVVFAYGADLTLDGVRRRLPPGVRFEAHGHGIGIAVVELDDTVSDGLLSELAIALAADVVAFDQRGCLSPRAVLAMASELATERFAGALAHALSEAEKEVPRGRLTAEEAADVTRYRDTASVAAALLRAGSGFVGVDLAGLHSVVAPVGRNVHVSRTTDFVRATRAFIGLVTAVGFFGAPETERRILATFPGARVSRLGSMQTPPFDGPVDCRARG